jgi:hypothetical protein
VPEVVGWVGRRYDIGRLRASSPTADGISWGLGIGTDQDVCDNADTSPARTESVAADEASYEALREELGRGRT